MSELSAEVLLLDAAWANDKAALADLLGSGTNTECTDDGGRTPLILACLRGSVEIAQMLIAAGLQLKQRFGFSIAQERGYESLAELIRSHLAQDDLLALETPGDTP